jgi:hypothetical protein
MCQQYTLRFQQYPMTIVYYVMRSKNEVLCAAAGRLAAEPNKTIKRTPLERNFSDLNY